MSRRPAVLGALVLGALVLAGCGDDDKPDGGGPATTVVAPAQTPTVSSQPHPLSRADVRVIERAKDEVAAYCRRVGQSLGGGPAPTTQDLERVNAALDELAAVAARDPAGQAPDGGTARLALGDIAENLEGTNCDPRLVDHIDEALSSLPAE